MKIRVTRRARGEIADILAYIARDDASAAQRVGRAIKDTIGMIAERPLVGIRNARVPELRSRLISRYPYRLHYVVRNQEVVILSVWHTARRPFEPGR